MYYQEILASLYRKKIRYLIVGGLALNLHGVPRSTMDIDIIISTDPENVMELVGILRELGYLPRLPVDPNLISDEATVSDWIENRNLKAFSFYHEADPFKVVDILLAHPLDFDRSFNDRSTKTLDDMEIYLASIDDLIRMKSYSGRPQDLSDIRLLEKLKDHLEGG